MVVPMLALIALTDTLVMLRCRSVRCAMQALSLILLTRTVSLASTADTALSQALCVKSALAIPTASTHSLRSQATQSVVHLTRCS